MSLRSRIAHGLGPVIRLTWLTGSAYVGVLSWALIASGKVPTPTSGVSLFAPAVGVIAFLLALSNPFGERSLNLARRAAAQLLLVATFVATAIVFRLVAEGTDLTRVRYLSFLAEHELLWRLPVPILAGLLFRSVVRAFLFPPVEEHLDGPNDDERVIRGPKKTKFSNESARYNKNASGKPFVLFAFLTVPLVLARQGLLILGAPGSGKTTLLLWLIRSWLELASKSPSRYRGYILDIKNDYRAHALATGTSVRTFFLHPLDKNSLCWDWAQDVTDDTVREFAMAMFPPRSAATADGGFFDGTAIKDLTGAINGFRKRFGTNFTEADLWEATATREGLYEVLTWDATNVTNAQCMERYKPGADSRLAANCFATFAEKAEGYYALAAIAREQWKRGQRFSIRQWRDNPDGGLVFYGWSAAHESQMRQRHAAYFSIQRRYLLDQPNSESRATLLMLDEAPSAGSIAAEVDLLLREGRTRGLITTLAIHNLGAWRTAFPNPESADAALSEAQNVACLRLTDPATAVWAAKRFSGEGTEIERTQYTENLSPDEKGQPRRSYSRNVVRELKQLISPAELTSLPSVGPGTGVNGFANTDEGNVYPFHYPFASLAAELTRFEPFEPICFESSDLQLRIPTDDTASPKTTSAPREENDLDDDDDLPYERP